MNSYTLVAQKVVLDAGRTIRAIFSRIEKLSPEQKADDAIFQQFYSQVESELQQAILSSYPDHTIHTKYLDDIINDSRHQWFVSGITSEENFQTGFEHFSVSIAYMMDGKLTSAAIYNPLSEEMYLASRNSGALYNGKKIHMYKNSGKLEDASVLATLCNDEDFQEKFTRFVNKTQSLRVLGDIALDICLVARGVYSAFFSHEFDEYDLKAAQLIAEETGLLVTNFKGMEDLSEGSLIATHPRLLKAMLTTLR